MKTADASTLCGCVAETFRNIHHIHITSVKCTKLHMSKVLFTKSSLSNPLTASCLLNGEELMYTFRLLLIDLASS